MLTFLQIKYKIASIWSSYQKPVVDQVISQSSCSLASRHRGCNSPKTKTYISFHFVLFPLVKALLVCFRRRRALQFPQRGTYFQYIHFISCSFIGFIHFAQISFLFIFIRENNFHRGKGIFLTLSSCCLCSYGTKGLDDTIVHRDTYILVIAVRKWSD